MKKGFTLIELLAVIVILAIIALIVTPVISDIIASARNAANQRSVEGHIKNIEYAIVQKGFENGDGDLSKYDDIVTDPAIRATLTIPASDPITCESYKIENGIVLEAKGCTDSTKNWNETHDYNNGGSDSGSSSSGSSTPAVAGDVETNEYGTTIYKGTILSTPVTIYYNVTTGNKCSESDWTSNGGNGTSGMKTGCLKFYAYMEDDISYTMILDRNTDNSAVAWYRSDDSSLGPITALSKLKSDTDSWVGTVTPKNYTYVFTLSNKGDLTYTINYSTENYKARLITALELTKAAGRTGFNSYTTPNTTYYILDNEYHWLYDNTADSSTGCTVDIPMGYWTSDAVSGTNFTRADAWHMNHGSIQCLNHSNYGYCYDCNVTISCKYGIRPVITVLKSALN